MVEHDKTFIVWSSYYGGENSRSYDSFYNGKYDMTLKEGITELDRRLGRNRETDKKISKNNNKNKDFMLER